MISSLEKTSFLTQKLTIKKKFSNHEIKLYQFFFRVTEIYPDNVLFLSPYIFFFIKPKYYFKAKRFLNSIRTKLINKKIMIINSESTLLRLLFSLFPDTYIHDIILNTNENETRIITIIFYFYEDRGIAVGRKGSYIKIINQMFNNFINLEKNDMPLKIKCEIATLS